MSLNTKRWIIKMNTIIKNAKVFRENCIFEDGDIAISGEFFADTAEIKSTEDPTASCNVIDAGGCYAIPGLIDLHFHGCVGYDFTFAKEDQIAEMARFEAANGVTAICPATLTQPEEQIAQACRRISTLSDPKGAALIGIHLEGPFFSYNKRGAQNPDYLHKPDADMILRLQKEAGGFVKLVAIAPELEGALDVISQLSDKMRFSVAHTEADYDTAIKAFEHGARQATHLFNGMPPLHHREPGVIGAARDYELCSAELICDSVHVDPSVVRATFAMFGDDRIIMISDSLMATGMADGIWDLGGLEVEVKGRHATLTSIKSLAGSITTLMGCLRIAVTEMNIPLTSAVKCSTRNPAVALGAYDKRGSITPGKYADLVLLNEDLSVSSVFLRGSML